MRKKDVLIVTIIGTCKGKNKNNVRSTLSLFQGLNKQAGRLKYFFINQYLDFDF